MPIGREILDMLDLGLKSSKCHFRKYLPRPFRLKNKVNGLKKKASKYIENKCSHCVLRLILIGKDAHRKGNIRHVRSWSEVIKMSFQSFFLKSKLAKIAKDQCSDCAMASDYSF